MSKIHIVDLIKALQEVEWDYEFGLKRRKGAATLHIPEFILKDLEWAIEKGNATPESEVECFRSVFKIKNSEYYEKMEG